MVSHSECRRCRFRGTLSSNERAAFCCDYCWLTGRSRTALPKREDGRCPAFEMGRRTRADVKRHERPIGRGMKYSHQALMAAYRKGLNDLEISRIVGCSDNAVYRWRKRNGLAANYRPAGREGI